MWWGSRSSTEFPSIKTLYNACLNRNWLDSEYNLLHIGFTIWFTPRVYLFEYMHRIQGQYHLISLRTLARAIGPVPPRHWGNPTLAPQPSTAQKCFAFLNKKTKKENQNTLMYISLSLGGQCQLDLGSAFEMRIGMRIRIRIRNDDQSA